MDETNEKNPDELLDTPDDSAGIQQENQGEPNADELTDVEEIEDTEGIDELDGLEPLADYEEEDRLARNRLIKRFIIGAAVLFALVAGAYGGYKLYDNFTHSYFMTINGQRFGMNEYELYASFGWEENDIVDWHLDMAVYEKAADEYNLMLDAQENRSLDELLISAREDFDAMENAPNVSDDRLRVIFTSLQGYWYNKLLDIFLEDAEIDYEDLEAQFAFYLNNYVYDYTHVLYKYILAESYESASESLWGIESGEMTFDEAAVAYSSIHDNETGFAYEITLEMLADVVEPAVLTELAALEPGDLSRPVQLPLGDDVYIILLTTEKIVVPEDDLRAQIEEHFLKYAASQKLDDWMYAEREKLNFSINEKAIARFNLN